jgi:hypothetical protein
MGENEDGVKPDQKDQRRNVGDQADHWSPHG